MGESRARVVAFLRWALLVAGLVTVGWLVGGPAPAAHATPIPCTGTTSDVQALRTAITNKVDPIELTPGCTYTVHDSWDASDPYDAFPPLQTSIIGHGATITSAVHGLRIFRVPAGLNSYHHIAVGETRPTGIAIEGLTIRDVDSDTRGGAALYTESPVVLYDDYFLRLNSDGAGSNAHGADGRDARGGAVTGAGGADMAGTVNMRAQWSPDGNQIVFTSTRNGTADIFTALAGGVSPVRRTTGNAIEDSASWQRL